MYNGALPGAEAVHVVEDACQEQHLELYQYSESQLKAKQLFNMAKILNVGVLGSSARDGTPHKSFDGILDARIENRYDRRPWHRLC